MLTSQSSLIVEKKLNAIWKETHRDYRAHVGHQRCILILRDGGTQLVPLRGLGPDEIERLLSSYYERHGYAAFTDLREGCCG